ncbi:hypothetical protein Goklo_014895 [Gossypium klotzschianum]|uniref:RNase H type-1 domain-containing protein n=1 Tax=Gossypium klotzschianum TaxID=34286 RepID=A0A7J8U9J3_9ROSI|nr:hypothetical protein [Gossypium klotzschianum]
MLNRLREVVSSKVLVPEEEDRLIWIHDNNGLKVPARARSFLWMISIDRLPTKEFLIRRGVGKSLWIISVTAACWSVWLARNELVFDRKWPTMNSLVFHSKMWALMWVRFWCPSRHGWVKFNVSGLVNEDEVGCGGVLRDSDGVARVLFSGPVTAKDSITAEVGVIIITLDVFLAMGWKGKRSLIIEI